MREQQSRPCDTFVRLCEAREGRWSPGCSYCGFSEGSVSFATVSQEVELLKKAFRGTFVVGAVVIVEIREMRTLKAREGSEGVAL